jgi:hypothetical protein
LPIQNKALDYQKFPKMELEQQRCGTSAKENEKDLRELPDDVRAEMEFVFVRNVKDVLAAAIPELAERLACDPVAC